MRRAVTYSPGDMRVEDAAEPRIEDGELLIEVTSVGLCGSDYHAFRGHHPYSKFPQVQGHEVAGRILRSAPGTQGLFRAGDLVVVDPIRPCTVCFACRRGQPNCCARLKVMGSHIPGALAEQIAAPEWAIHGIGSLDLKIAPLVEPLAVGLQAAKRGDVRTGDRVVVFGGGPIGLAVTLSCRERGAEVLVIDRVRERLQKASIAGATQVCDSTAEDVGGRVQEFTSGDGAAVVIEATGVPELIQRSVEIVANSGTVVVVGLSDKTVELPVIDLTRKEVNIHGSRNSVDLFPEAIELASRNQDTLRSWVTHEVDLEQAPSMLQFAIENPSAVEKALVYPNGIDSTLG